MQNFKTYILALVKVIFALLICLYPVF